MYKIAVLISGGGTNLQAIIDNIENKYLDCSIEYVISDTDGVYGIERAKGNNINAVVLDKKVHKKNLSDEILKIIDNKVDLIVLAGFLSILKGNIIKRFKDKIINIHPALIPSFCGKGMYGIKVHERVIEYGVKVSGCTVHFVDEGTDTGAIILQKSVEVFQDDTPEILQARVLEQEHIALSEAIKYIIEDKLRVEGRKVKLLK